MHFLICLLLHVIFVSLSTTLAYPHHDVYRSKREASNSNLDEWLKELESQIFNEDELQSFLSPPSPEPKLVTEITNSDSKEILSAGNKNETSDYFEDAYDNQVPVVEPIVITAKPYLLGDNSDELTETELTSESDGIAMKNKSEFSEPFIDVIDGDTEPQASITTMEPTTDVVLDANHDRKNDFTRSPSQSHLQWKTPISNLFYSTISTSPTITNYKDPLFFSTSTNPPKSAIDVNWKNPVLDEILIEKPAQFRPNKFFTYNRSEISDGGSEVKSFVVLIKNQMVFVILGCILSFVVIIALVIFGYQILKRLNERSAVTLIAHYEHDMHGQLIPYNSEKGNDKGSIIVAS